MKIGIIGFGFVGKALHGGLKQSVNSIEIDPKLNTNIEDLKKHNGSEEDIRKKMNETMELAKKDFS